MLHLGHDYKLPAPALDRQFAFLPRRAAERGPHLSHGRSAHGNPIDRDQMITRLHAVRSFRQRRLAVEVRDSKDREPPVVFRA